MSNIAILHGGEVQEVVRAGVRQCEVTHRLHLKIELRRSLWSDIEEVLQLVFCLDWG